MENDLIRRSDALAAFAESTSAMPEKQGRRRIEEIPAVDAVEVVPDDIGRADGDQRTHRQS